jgi:hypothetical protein
MSSKNVIIIVSGETPPNMPTRGNDKAENGGGIIGIWEIIRERLFDGTIACRIDLPMVNSSSGFSAQIKVPNFSNRQ